MFGDLVIFLLGPWACFDVIMDVFCEGYTPDNYVLVGMMIFYSSFLNT